MEKQYFMIQEGIQTGPFPKEMLRMQGLTPDTFVWREGLADWVKAGTLPDLADIFNDSAFGAYAQPAPVEYGGNHGQNAGPQDYPKYGGEYGNQPYNGGYGNEGYNGYQSPYNNGQPVPHTNWLAPAIIATVVGALFSCVGMIFGIIGITKASSANKFYDLGDKARGDIANSSARTMTIVAFALAVLGLLFVVTGLSGSLTRNLLNNLL